MNDRFALTGPGASHPSSMTWFWCLIDLNRTTGSKCGTCVWACIRVCVHVCVDGGPQHWDPTEVTPSYFFFSFLQFQSTSVQTSVLIPFILTTHVPVAISRWNSRTSPKTQIFATNLSLVILSFRLRILWNIFRVKPRLLRLPRLLADFSPAPVSLMWKSKWLMRRVGLPYCPASRLISLLAADLHDCTDSINQVALLNSP